MTAALDALLIFFARYYKENDVIIKNFNYIMKRRMYISPSLVSMYISLKQQALKPQKVHCPQVPFLFNLKMQ